MKSPTGNTSDQKAAFQIFEKAKESSITYDHIARTDSLRKHTEEILTAWGVCHSYLTICIFSTPNKTNNSHCSKLHLSQPIPGLKFLLRDLNETEIFTVMKYDTRH